MLTPEEWFTEHEMLFWLVVAYSIGFFHGAVPGLQLVSTMVMFVCGLRASHIWYKRGSS